jgi:hypothetical protein
MGAIGFPLGIELSARRGGGGGAASAPGTSATSPRTSRRSRRVTSASDLMGLAAPSLSAAGAGPKVVTDGLGRKCWRFESAEYLNVASSLVGDTRAITVLMVGRCHRNHSGNLFGLGNVAAGTQVNVGVVMNVSASGSVPPYLRTSGVSASSDATNGKHVICGSQVQVLGVVSRTTANGASRLYHNLNVASGAQVSIGNPAVVGAEIGRNPFAAGSSGSWAQFDLYEMAVFLGTLSNAQADAAVAAMVANWSIPAVTNRLVIEGDSIHQGLAVIPYSDTPPSGVSSGKSIGMALTEPGSPIVAADTSVVNMAVSGSSTVTQTTRRDATNTMFDKLLPGRNRILNLIGRNNLGSLGQDAPTCYAAIVAVLHTAGTGYLERGWEVIQGVNIAVSSSMSAANDALRTSLRSAQFLTDCLANTGQTYQGKLRIVDLPLITVGGDTKLDTAADSADTAIYQNDSTHPTLAGQGLMISGGDTPAHGYVAALGI